MKSLLLSIAFLFTLLPYCSGQANQEPSQDSTVTYKKRGFLDIFEGDPGKAVLYSLICPGAGQAYNKKWWKVPIVLGVEGFFISNIVRQTRDYRSLDSKWRYFLELETLPAGCLTPYTSAAQIKEDRDDARQKMEYSWVYWGLAHIVVTFEAFVNRHLMEFDVSDDLSLKFNPQVPVHPDLGNVAKFGIYYTLD